MVNFRCGTKKVLFEPWTPNCARKEETTQRFMMGCLMDKGTSLLGIDLVALHYQLQQGLVVLAENFSEKKIKENFHVQDG